jgi:RNA polymerase-binding transcription factor DksA
VQPSARELLENHLARIDEQIRSLEQQHAGVVAAAQNDNADDEHDPEGSTIAFERQQTAALLERARGSRADTLAAMDRLVAGAYGVCAVCGTTIAAERLVARPNAKECITCADSARR